MTEHEKHRDRDNIDPVRSAEQHPTTTPPTESELPRAVGVYDRPAGAGRFPIWLVILVLVLIAVMAYLVFTFLV